MPWLRWAGSRPSAVSAGMAETGRSIFGRVWPTADGRVGEWLWSKLIFLYRGPRRIVLLDYLLFLREGLMKFGENACKMIHFLNTNSQDEKADALRGGFSGRPLVRDAEPRRYKVLVNVGGDEKTAAHFATDLRGVDLVKNCVEIRFSGFFLARSLHGWLCSGRTR